MTAMLALVTIEEVSGPGGVQLIQAGRTINDAGVQAAYTAAGGVLVLATDPVFGPQAAIVQKLRNRGANEDTCTRLMLAALYTGAQGLLQRITVDLPLATLKTKTSTTAFNLGAALPANFRISDYDVNVIAVLAGTGPLTAATMTVQNTGETAGALIASTDIFTATGILKNVGSDPYGSRGGQQLQATITATGGTLAALTAGHVAVDIFGAVVP
jgi:hypothetical protein